MYYSTDDLYVIHASIGNLVALKTLFDLGYDVEGLKFWDESAFGNHSHDDILQHAFVQIFKVELEEIVSIEEAHYGYAYHLPIPLLIKLRELELIPSINGAISRFLTWFEEQLENVLDNLCIDFAISLTATGFRYDCYSEGDVYEAIVPLEKLKNKAERYVLAMEGRQKEWKK